MLAAVLLSACSNAPVQSWAPTLSNHNAPFGTSLCQQLFYEQAGDEDSVPRECNFYLNMHDPDHTSADAEKLYRAGDCAMYASEFHESSLVEGDTFCIERYVESVNSGHEQLAEITDAVYKRKYYLPKQLCGRYFKKDIKQRLINLHGMRATKVEVLAYADGKPIAVRAINAAGGRVMLVSTPLLFSNFSLRYADRRNISLCLWLARWAGFWQMWKGNQNALQEVVFINPHDYAPTPRPNDYNSSRYTYQCPISYEPGTERNASTSTTSEDYDLLQSLFKDLANAIWTCLLICTICLIFRRKQTIIPLFEGYRNRTAEYVRQVALLYYAEGDYAQILRNRVVSFFAEVKDRQHLQLADTEHEKENAALLAAALGANINLQAFVRDCNLLLAKKQEANASLLASMSEKMNAITKVLKGEKTQNDLPRLFQPQE